MDPIDMAMEHAEYRVTPAYENSAMGWVYLLHAEHSEFYKIGFTRHDVAVRASQVRVASPFPIRVLGAISARLADEKALHRYLQAYHTNGEWFLLRGQVLDAIHTWFEVAHD